MARRSSATAARPFHGSTDGEPEERVGVARDAAGHEVVGDRGQPGAGLGVPRQQHGEHLVGPELVGHLVDGPHRDLVRKCLSVASFSGPIASTSYSCVDGWTWMSMARHCSPRRRPALRVQRR